METAVKCNFLRASGKGGTRSAALRANTGVRPYGKQKMRFWEKNTGESPVAEARGLPGLKNQLQPFTAKGRSTEMLKFFGRSQPVFPPSAYGRMRG